MPVASLTVVKSSIVALLSAADTYTPTAASDLYLDAEIEEFAHQGDEQVILNIGSTVGHFSRSSLLTVSADIASGAQLPPHIGDAGQIVIKRWTSDTVYVPGTPTTEDAITRYRQNTGTAPYNVYGDLPHDAPNSPLSGYYNLKDDNLLHYTGAAARAWLFNYTRTSLLQSPAIYTNAIVGYALGLLFAKDGGDPNAAGYYMSLAQSMLAMIRGEAKILPDLAPFARAA